MVYRSLKRARRAIHRRKHSVVEWRAGFERARMLVGSLGAHCPSATHAVFEGLSHVRKPWLDESMGIESRGWWEFEDVSQGHWEWLERARKALTRGRNARATPDVTLGFSHWLCRRFNVKSCGFSFPPTHLLAPLPVISNGRITH